jgi:hypothetical protein
MAPKLSMMLVILSVGNKKVNVAMNMMPQASAAHPHDEIEHET